MMYALSIKKLLRSKLFLGTLLAIVGMSVAVPAYAHYIFEEGYTYSSDYDCTWNRSEISHGSGGGYSKSDVRAKVVGYKGGVPVSCKDDFIRPVDHLRAKWKLYKLNGTSWQLCLAGGYSYNPVSASELTVSKDHGHNPPCSAGIYRTVAFGHLKNDGEWHGGSISSGATGHTLP